MKNLSNLGRFLLFAIIIGLFSELQLFSNARVQVIHNAADPAASLVDIYVNNVKPVDLDDLGFREATPYLNLPSGQNITLSVNSSSSNNSAQGRIQTFDLGQLDDNGTYVLVANGIIGSGYANPVEGRVIDFDLISIEGSETASSQNSVAVNIYHGVTDAPNVNIYDDINSSAIISELIYEEDTGYLPFPPQEYNFWVAETGNKSNVLGQFEIDLSELGGEAAFLFASGFADIDAQEEFITENYAFGLYAALTDGTVLKLQKIAPAIVQVIHNSAFPAFEEVDLYINDEKPADLDDFAFRSATSFLELPAETDITVKIADPSSTGPNDQILESFDLGQLSYDTKYVLIANGVSGEGFNNPDDQNRNIDLALYPFAGRAKADAEDQVLINVFHGVTDAPAVDIYTDINGNPLIEDLDYAEATGYTGLDEDDYELTVTATGDANTVAGVFDADLNSLGGASAVVFASGFLDPLGQTAFVPYGNDLRLFAVLIDGTVLELPKQGPAKVQIIHNSADPSAETVDIYVNGNKPDELDDLTFRSATSFLDVQADTDIEIKVASSTSSNENDQVIATFDLGKLERNKEYVVIANGVLGDGFQSAVFNRDLSFDLFPINTRASALEEGTVEVNVFHGVTDAPAVDIYADIQGNPLIPGLDYANSTGIVALSADDYDLTITPEDDVNTEVGVYDVDLTGLSGGSAIVFASGFLSIEDEPASVSENQSFGLFAALPDGSVIEFPLVIDKAMVQVIHNSALPSASVVDVYINGEKPDALNDFAFRTATPFLEITVEEEVIVTISGSESENSNDQVISTINLGMLEKDMDYVVVANGISGDGFNNPDPGNRDISLDLFAFEGKSESSDNEKVALNVFHGSTDAPSVDIYPALNSSVERLVSDLDYGENSGYIELDPQSYYLSITPAGQSGIVQSFIADIRSLGGNAGVLFASGFLSIEDEPDPVDEDQSFGLYLALPDGSIVELPTIGRASFVQVIHNSALPAAKMVDIYVNGQKPASLDDFEFRSATPYLELPSQTNIEVKVAGPTSSGPQDQILGTFDLGELDPEMSYVIVANGIAGPGFFNPEPNTRDISLDVFPMEGMLEADVENEVALNVFHGVTDAPAVDVYASGNFLVQNIDYGEASGYTNVSAESHPLIVTAAGNTNVTVGRYNADLSTIGGGSAVVFASGFFDQNAQSAFTPYGYDLRLFAALADGTVLELPKEAPAKVQVIHNSADPDLQEVDIYIDGAKPVELDDLEFRKASPYLELPFGTEFEIKVADSSSRGPNDKILSTHNIGPLESDSEYVLIANGVVGEDFTNPYEPRDIAFQLFSTGGLSRGYSEDMVEVKVFHGSTDAPAVDIYANNSFSDPIIAGLDYGKATEEYLSLTTDFYALIITAQDDKETVAGVFGAQLSELGGESVVIFASGFLDPSVQPDEVTSNYSLGLFAALSDGTVIQLEPTTSVDDEIVRDEIISVYPNPATQILTINTGMSNFRNIEIYDMAGNKMNGLTFDKGNEITKVNVSSLSNGVYILRILTETGGFSRPVIISR